MDSKCGAETEGKATQRLPYLEIYPINSHQTPRYYGQEVHIERSLLWLSLEGLCQSLTHTEADASSQPLD